MKLLNEIPVTECIPTYMAKSDKPLVSGHFIFIEHYKNLSLENIVQEIDGVVYTEEWRDVVGYEGIYQVSSFGRIKSLGRTTSQNKKIIENIKKQSKDKDGYRHILSCKDGKVHTLRVHRLVCTAFHGIIEDKPIVNHKNFIKHYNFYKNLEWSTISHNTQHAYDNGRIKNYNTGRFGEKSIFSKKIQQFDLNDKFIKSFIGIREAARVIGINRNDINRSLKGIITKYDKYKFRYA